MINGSSSLNFPLPVLIFSHLSRACAINRFSLKAAVAGFLAHYHAERNHQGLGNKLIAAGEEVGSAAGEVACYERFGGMLRYYYYQKAA
jgi:putative transposase